MIKTAMVNGNIYSSQSINSEGVYYTKGGNIKKESAICAFEIKRMERRGKERNYRVHKSNM